MPSTLIDVPPDDVFRNDRLGLEPAIEVRSEALLSSSPQAIAIDAGWGSGKTTFMRLWAAYLRKEGVKVVEFNAWKFSMSDPLDALTREILREFNTSEKEQAQPQPHRRLVEFVRYAGPFVKSGAKLGSLLSPEFAEATEVVEPVSKIGMLFAKVIPAMQSKTNAVEDTVPEIDSPNAFTCALSEAAGKWSSRPVVIMVDELDRCSPEYAVEMLQLLEHIFYAENVVFVVSMNRAELAHSVKEFYGEGFDANGYLERFFDNVFGLPASNRAQYINSSLSNVSQIFGGESLWPVAPFLHASDLSLREIDRSIQQFKEVLKQGSPDGATRALTYLWVARSLAPTEYRQFLSREVSDMILADAVFANGACSEFRAERRAGYSSHAHELEATLMLLCSDIYYSTQVPTFGSSGASIPSELLAYHRATLDNPDDTENDIPPSYSKRVIELAERSNDVFSTGLDRASLMASARLLERDSPPPKD